MFGCHTSGGCWPAGLCGRCRGGPFPSIHGAPNEFQDDARVEQEDESQVHRRAQNGFGAEKQESDGDAARFGVNRKMLEREKRRSHTG